MILWGVVILVLFFLCWVLFMPVALVLDTERGDYSVSQRGTVRFWLDRNWRPQMNVFGIHIPVRIGKKQKKARAPAKKKSKKRPFSFSNTRALARRILRSITVKRLCVDIDTDDVILNAQMMPVLHYMSRGPVSLTTNYHGRVAASLNVEISLYKIGWAFLLFFTIKNQ
jgi:hypothetical protein